jgi:hypothetical protein
MVAAACGLLFLCSLGTSGALGGCLRTPNYK